ncbi:hypothetical protein [Urechidicola croceus]|uniref:Uncharacterized protein n=1 Tax=Urechidicola croceus TaxID=1850246 RepID=A0A1D8P6N4_9FLAO|nr:hypothetical protein [Urechidicola croceus]AOW20228.1 hypothetical protein LPB138_05850 [Urechidicola croceus]
MKKKTFTLLFAFIVSYGYSQKHEHTIDTIVKNYIPLKLYKRSFTEKLTKKDSLNFKFKDNDTLVLVDNFIPKGVYVPYEFKDSIFLNHYKKIAFNHKKNKFSYDTKMKYWKDDIKIFFSKSISKNDKKQLMRLASELSSKVDSLNIYQVRKLEDSNFTIYNKGDYEYETRMGNYSKSYYYIHWNGKSQIYKGNIRLVNENQFSDDESIMKLKRLFIQALGHFKLNNDLECENYFANCDTNKKFLTELDLEILKYHYSYGICKGTDLATFVEQHIIAKEALKEHNHRINFAHVE